MLEFATVDGARACGLAANNPAGTIVTADHPGLVDTFSSPAAWSNATGGS